MIAPESSAVDILVRASNRCLGRHLRNSASTLTAVANEALAQFYQGKSVSAVLGDESFKQQIIEQHGRDDPEIARRKHIREPVSLDEITAVVARTLDCDQRQIYESVHGSQNLARMLIAHFAHRSGQMVYREINEALGMNHYSAVASSIRRLNIPCQKNKHILRLKKRIWQEMTAAQT